jgi:Domain of unknown function (DUF6362)
MTGPRMTVQPHAGPCPSASPHRPHTASRGGAGRGVAGGPENPLAVPPVPVFVGGGISAPEVIARLEEAGATLLAMRLLGVAPSAIRSSMPEPLREVWESYGWDPEPIRAAIPSCAAIDRMDEAWGWLGLVPPDKRVLRRIVAARSLVHPLSGRHCVPWRRLGRIIGASHEAARVWHGQGITIIVQRLSHNVVIAA